MKSITRFTRNIRGNRCLNCENDISEEDNFCSRCGQVNDLKKVSLKQYLSAYFDDFLSFDGRLLNTIATLIFKPGYVTKNYVEGKRMRYMNPFKLYLQITILFFLVVGLFKTIDRYKLENESSGNILSKLNSKDGVAVLDSITSETLKDLEENDIKIDTVTLSAISAGIAKASQRVDSTKSKSKKRDQDSMLILPFVDSIMLAPGSLETFKLDDTYQKSKDSVMTGFLKAIDIKIESLLIEKKGIAVNDAGSFNDGWIQISKKGPLKNRAVKHMDSIFKSNSIDYKISESLIRSTGSGWFENTFDKVKGFMEYQKEHPDVSTFMALDALDYEKNYWNVFLYSKSSDWNEAVEDPENYGTEFKDRILSRVSVALFFLLPLFTLVVSLLYLRRKFNYTENLVFVFHVQTVFFLLLLLFIIIGRIAHSKAIIWVFLVIFMIHLYMAMRQFYQQGRIKTLVKYIILNSAFLVMATIGAIIISFIAFML